MAMVLGGIITAYAVTPETIKGRELQSENDIKVKGLSAAADGFSLHMVGFENLDVRVDKKMRLGKVLQKVDGETSKVAFKVTYNQEEYYFSELNVYNKDGVLCFYDCEQLTDDSIILTAEIPTGTYDVMVTLGRVASLYSNYELPNFAKIIKENIEMTGDVGLDFDVEEVSNTVKFRSVGPDGERHILPIKKYHYDEDDVWTEDIYEGNVQDIFISSYIVHNDYGVVGITAGNCGIIKYIDEDTQQTREGAFDIFINDVSDKYHFYQHRSMARRDGSGAYVVGIYQDCLTDEVVVNNPSDYVYYTDTFAQSPAREKYGVGEYKYVVDSRLCINDVQQDRWEAFLTKGNSDIQICAPLVEASGHKYQMFVIPKYYDASIEVVYDYGDGDIETDVISYGTYGLPVTWTGSEFEYVNNNHSRYGNYAFQMLEDPNVIPTEYPGHPAFSFMTGKKTVPYGNSCPINVVMDQTYYVEWIENVCTAEVDCCFLGRLGEVRTADYLDLAAELKYDGEVVCESYSGIAEWLYTHAETKKPKGVIELTFYNPNVAVDGITGYNKTYVYADKTKEDGTAPTLQMLQFKNRQGDITDRFPDVSYGVLEFAGGDFNFHNSESDGHFYFDCKEQDVKVEYAPYGTGCFAELTTVEEVPELYFMPGFGYFYRASLKDVEGLSANGWFDLRITLTDKSGNRQEQTLSPAFKVENLVGVADILVSEAAQDAEYYNLQGVRVTNPTAGGVYIVRRGANVSKELFK